MFHCMCFWALARIASRLSRRTLWARELSGQSRRQKEVLFCVMRRKDEPDDPRVRALYQNRVSLHFAKGNETMKKRKQSGVGGSGEVSDFLGEE
jgi:hypothetical protein